MPEAHDMPTFIIPILVFLITIEAMMIRIYRMGGGFKARYPFIVLGLSFGSILPASLWSISHFGIGHSIVTMVLSVFTTTGAMMLWMVVFGKLHLVRAPQFAASRLQQVTLQPGLFMDDNARFNKICETAQNSANIISFFQELRALELGVHLKVERIDHPDTPQNNEEASGRAIRVSLKDQTLVRVILRSQIKTKLPWTAISA